MTHQYTTHRLSLLFKILIACSQRQEAGGTPIFNEWDRIFINQERAKLLQGITDYKQDTPLEQKIQKVITNNN